ncbi:hypothetical protein BH11PLA2_BH11PLA2_08130 [soil metagenome]
MKWISQLKGEGPVTHLSDRIYSHWQSHTVLAVAIHGDMALEMRVVIDLLLRLHITQIHTAHNSAYDSRFKEHQKYIDILKVEYDTELDALRAKNVNGPENKLPNDIMAALKLKLYRLLEERSDFELQYKYLPDIQIHNTATPLEVVSRSRGTPFSTVRQKKIVAGFP